MKGLVKGLLIVVGVVVAVIIVAAVWLVFIFDPNDFKQQLADTVREQTGRELTIEGDIGLSFFPWLAVEVGPTRLSNAAGFGDEPFVAIGDARMGVQLLPLIRREIRLSEVRLGGLELNLMVDAAGRSNWEDLGGAEAEAEAAAPEQPAEGAALEALEIGGLTIENARIRYDDRQAKQSVSLDEWNLKTGRIAPGAPIGFETSLKAETGEPVMLADVKVASTIEFSQDMQKLSLDAPRIDAELTGADIPGGKLPIKLAMESVQVDLGAETMNLKQLTLATLGLDFDADLGGEAILGEPRFKGRFALAEFSPRKLMERLEIEAPVTADDAVLKKFLAAGKLSATSNSVAFDELEFVLDDTKLTGTAGVTDLERQAIRFDLNVDAIDVDRYLPPPVEGEETAAEPSEDVEIPVETLRELNADGNLRIGELRAGGLFMSDVRVGVKAGKGQIRLQPMDVSLYEGKATGEITLNATTSTPTLAVSETLAGVQLGLLTQEMIERALVTGAANGSVQLTARGKTVNGMRDSLSGNMSFDVGDGAIEGVDLVYAVRLARSLYRKQMPPAPPRPQRTVFESLSVSATAADGVINSDDLKVFMPVLRVTGAGSVDLASSGLDYELVTTVMNVPEDGAEQDLKDMEGSSIPIRIGGTLDDPKITPDVSALVKKQVQEVIESEEVQEKIKEQSDKLKDKLKGILGN